MAGERAGRGLMIQHQSRQRSPYTFDAMPAETCATESKESGAWQVWIDTGGTFTDCLALPPGADFADARRAKVLSSGALRGRVVQWIDETSLRIGQNWGACDDLVRGFAFQRVGGGITGARIKRFVAAESRLEFESPRREAIGAGDVVELQGPESAPILAARLVTQTPADAALPAIHMRLATTRGTNALLERKGAPTVFFMTEGFGDLLLIGDQQRPDLFAINIEKPPPLYEKVVEVPERLAADGAVLKPLDVDRLANDAQRLFDEGLRVAAVALMHSHMNPDHERQVGDLLRRIGFDHVSLSSEIAPLIRLLPRAQTAVVDAYLAPVVRAYLRDIQNGLDSSSLLHVMSSAGGLAQANGFRACDSLLSGPAGGVAGAAAVARLSNVAQVIGFDMGGTSTDVARYDGDFEYRFEHAVAGVRVMAPALAIETVAAGGGSICEFTDGRLTVGPQSAGAQPGPACYGAGGPLTITDVNLLLGRLQVEQFEIPIDRQAAQRAAKQIWTRMNADDAEIRLESVLQGFLDIANERMAAAIEQVSLRLGYDPRDFALVAFGGAGGQHACAVADRLGIGTIIMPADASLLSALGLGYAVIERFAQRQVLRTLDNCAERMPGWFDELADQARRDVVAERIAPESVVIRRKIANLRLRGQDATLAIDVGDAGIERWRDVFLERYRTIDGHEASINSQPIEVESMRVVASSIERRSTIATSASRSRAKARLCTMTSACFAGQWAEVNTYDRHSCAENQLIIGPAILFDRRSTCVIEAGWQGAIDAADALIVQKIRAATSSPLQRPEAVDVELFSNRFAAIADEMGQMLQRTALSTNVKERLDFSCALLDAAGDLVVNAPHIPVHLGAIGMCVRAVRDVLPMDDGDVAITNHPAFGGTHLPDVTVITPVFVDQQLIGYVANRAHHAEIGGTRPGSMPPFATTLAEEGVVIRPQHLIRRGQSYFDVIERLFTSGPYPSRAVTDNMADVRAAVAANHRGAQALIQLTKAAGVQAVTRHMRALTDRAERMTRRAIERLQHGRRAVMEMLDDGSQIQIEVETHGDAVVVDFAGSAAVHPGNLNATPAIVRSAVMYVLRLLIGERLPLNEGIMRAVLVKQPHGMLNPHFDDDATRCPAVVGGNTETSQRIVDALLKALNLCACSQGTMNNVLFGNEHFGYYETVCGGSGAAPGFHGADAVHTHMTNTRITDPEIIEHRYPVRLNRFAIRRGSGGAGTWRGGDGAIREFTFLRPMSLSILSQHRTTGPYGSNGGHNGLPGRQHIVRADGKVIALASIDGCEVYGGDCFVLETPGGGGWG